MKSANWRAKIFHAGVARSSRRRFGPVRASRPAASAVESPRSGSVASEGDDVGGRKGVGLAVRRRRRPWQRSRSSSAGVGMCGPFSAGHRGAVHRRESRCSGQNRGASPGLSACLPGSRSGPRRYSLSTGSDASRVGLVEVIGVTILHLLLIIA